MLDLLEDDLGLWEIDRLARNELADLPDKERSQRARGLLSDWLGLGWVNVFERQMIYLPGNDAEFGPRMAVEPARVARVLSDNSVWDYDAIQDAPTRFFVRINERGRTEFREDGRRRGLFRS